MEEEFFSKVILSNTLYGTNETIITWENEMQSFKQNYLRAMAAFRSSEEPSDLLTQLSKFIEVVIEDPEMIKGSEEFKKFFYEEWISNIIDALQEARTNDDEVGFKNTKIQSNWMLF